MPEKPKPSTDACTVHLAIVDVVDAHRGLDRPAELGRHARTAFRGYYRPMRIAILSDVHGNPIALDAVLRDLEAQGGADEHWLIGDYSAMGYDPVTPIERLTRLPNVKFARGNTDRYVVEGPRPPTVEAVGGDQSKLDMAVLLSRSFAWTQGYLAAAGLIDWMAGLGLELRTILPDGTRLLAVHAAPGTDDGPGFTPAQSDDELRAALKSAEADVVVVGHVHYPHDRVVDGVTVCVTGGISNPPADDLRAKYVLIEADAAGHRIERRHVDYDLAAVLDPLAQARTPSDDYTARFFRGEFRPPWL
jgi:predicted phosphodiesterase